MHYRFCVYRIQMRIDFIGNVIVTRFRSLWIFLSLFLDCPLSFTLSLCFFYVESIRLEIVCHCVLKLLKVHNKSTYISTVFEYIEYHGSIWCFLCYCVSPVSLTIQPNCTVSFEQLCVSCAFFSSMHVWWHFLHMNLCQLSKQVH